jgi:ribonuclease HI
MSSALASPFPSQSREVEIESTRADIYPTNTLGTLVIEDANTAKDSAKRCAQLADLAYFTDGSRNKDRRAGAACIRVVKGNHSTIGRPQRPMGRGKEAFDAELMAILLALQDADRRRENNILPGVVHIVSDSQAALQRIQTLGDGPGQRLVHAIHQWERKLIYLSDELEIRYQWVPSHEGVWANEEADMAAKATAEAPDNQIMYCDKYRSLSNISRLISEGSTRERKRFIDQHRGKKFSWNGKLSMNPALKSKPKRDAAVFWQFACGHALTGDHLAHKLKKTEDDTCWHCGSSQPQTRTHLFERCAAFREEQKQLRTDIRNALKEEALAKKKKRWKIRVPVREYFARECLTRAVLDFLRATKIGRTGRPPEA